MVYLIGHMEKLFVSIQTLFCLPNNVFAFSHNSGFAPDDLSRVLWSKLW